MIGLTASTILSKIPKVYWVMFGLVVLGGIFKAQAWHYKTELAQQVAGQQKALAIAAQDALEESIKQHELLKEKDHEYAQKLKANRTRADAAITRLLNSGSSSGVQLPSGVASGERGTLANRFHLRDGEFLIRFAERCQAEDDGYAAVSESNAALRKLSKERKRKR